MARIRTRMLLGVGLIVATVVGLPVESTAEPQMAPGHLPAAPGRSGEAEESAREQTERELMARVKALEAENRRLLDMIEETFGPPVGAAPEHLPVAPEPSGEESHPEGQVAEHLPAEPPLPTQAAEHLPVEPGPSVEEAGIATAAGTGEPHQAEEQPPVTGSTKPEPRWHTTIEVALSSGVLVFGALLVALELLYLKSRSEWDATWTMKIVGLTLVLTTGMFLITAGFSQNQTAPMMGLLGTVAGYLLGRQAAQRVVAPSGP